MKKLSTLLLALALTITSLRAQIPAHIQQRLQDTLNYLQQLKKYKGISAAVTWRGHGEWQGVAGISYPGHPLTHSMVIGIGSNTKTFLAAAILRLVELEMLSLNDSVGKWLAPIPHVKGSITIRQLLQHTSGLYNYTTHPSLGDSVNANPWRIWTKAELVNKFLKAPFFTPGQTFYYSNTNYLLAGMIAEIAAGKNIAEWIREVVITAAGLNNTFFPPYETVTSTRAHVWTNFGNGYLQYQDLPLEFYSLADAAGGMMSDAADNNKFWISLFNGEIIQKSTLINEMMNWKQASSSLSYGLGLAKQLYYGNETYSHGGSILGQLNENLTDTLNGITISVLTNQDSVTNVHALIGLYKILLQQHKVGLTSLSSARDLIYPNPATSVVNVRAASPVRTAAVYDVTGRMILSSSMNSSAFEFDVSGLPAGIYILKMGDGNGERVRRFVKE